MANCDFGNLCDCSDCRTITYKIKCPMCGCQKTESTVTTSTLKTDRKGVNYYELTPVPDSSIICDSCKK